MSGPAYVSSTPPPSTARLLIASALALAVAVVVLVVAILPAEYGIDPLGTGKALGLLSDSAPPAAAPPPDGQRVPHVQGPLTYYGAPYLTDGTSFVIGPYDYVEYKYRLEPGATMQFEWRASALVLHNFHSDPDDTESEPSFDGEPRASGFGSFTAPSRGLHGWYWENPGDTAITITLTSSGFYSSAMEFRPNKRSIPHELKMAGTP